MAARRSLFGYGETEIDPVIQSEILFETGRAEARIAVLEILFAIGFGVWFGFGSKVFGAVAIFCLFTVAPLLIDSGLRRRASNRMRGIGPQPRGPAAPPGTHPPGGAPPAGQPGQPGAQGQMTSHTTHEQILTGRRPPSQ